jgi:hypothetical protein
MISVTSRQEAAAKAVATRKARAAAALAATVGPVKSPAGFYAFVCPKCKDVQHVLSAQASVYHRCPASALKYVDYITPATE